LRRQLAISKFHRYRVQAMANPRKPANLKLVTGTRRPDRDTPAVDFPLLNRLPPPPNWLPNVHAVNEWHRLSTILQANGLLTEGGLSALGQLCALHGSIIQAYHAGVTPNAAMIAQLRGFLNDFGLTPVAQMKVGSSNKSTNQDNPFSALDILNEAKK